MLRSELLPEIYNALNVSKATYGTYDGTPIFPSSAITQALLDADEEVARLICSAEGHPQRERLFTTTQDTPGIGQPVFQVVGNHTNTSPPTYFDIASPRDSEICAVEIVIGGSSRAAMTAPSNKIKLWTADAASYGGASIVGGYYDQQSNQIIFSGDSITYVFYRVRTHNRAASDNELYTPDCYRTTVIKRTLQFLSTKLEDMMQAAQFYGGQVEADAALILDKAPTTGDVQIYQQQR